MSGTNAVAWAVGATTTNSSLPVWPAYIFGLTSLAGVYVLGAALARKWPFHLLALAPAELLDDCIRQGRDARERIIREPLNVWEVAGVAAAWTLRTANLLHEHFPAIADEFLLVSGENKECSEQALTLRRIAVKIAVLATARKELGS